MTAFEAAMASACESTLKEVLGLSGFASTVYRLSMNGVSLSDCASRPADFDELTTRLRQRRIPEVRHVFKSEVAMALEYLKGRGVVAEEDGDRTEKTLDTLRAKSESKHLGPCPAELSLGARKEPAGFGRERTIRRTSSPSPALL